MMMQTLNHLVPTLHLIKYSHAAIMLSQNSNTGEFVLIPPPKKRNNKRIFSESTVSSSTTPSLHSLVSKLLAEEAQEGSIVRNDENV